MRQQHPLIVLAYLLACLWSEMEGSDREGEGGGRDCVTNSGAQQFPTHSILGSLTTIRGRDLMCPFLLDHPFKGTGIELRITCSS
jgi:hypothetical protein